MAVWGWRGGRAISWEDLVEGPDPDPSWCRVPRGDSWGDGDLSAAVPAAGPGGWWGCGVVLGCPTKRSGGTQQCPVQLRLILCPKGGSSAGGLCGGDCRAVGMEGP